MLKINKDIQIGDTGRTLEMLGETVAETLPVGTIAPYGGSTSQVPQNWLPCDGREVSRLEYAKLFSVIGTRFGVGDGSTTFNLPDLQGKVPVGQDVNDAAFDVLGETGGEKTHTLTADEIPPLNAYAPAETTGGNMAYISNWSGYTGSGLSNKPITRTKNTGATAHNNLQPYQVTLYIIKAFDQQLGNLRSESLPVGSEIDFAGTVSEIPEGWEEVTNSESYSTTEVKTNKTWIDGKPIYRKVINIGEFSATDMSINTGITNISEVVSFNGSFKRKDRATPYFYSIDNVFMNEWRINYNTGVVTMSLNNQYVTMAYGYLILEYTKTTD